MWLAFRALSLKAKLGIILIVVGILIAISGVSHYIGYQKGLNVSRVAIANYERNAQRIVAAAARLQTKTDVRYVTEYKDRVNYVDRVVYKTRTVIETSVPEQFTLSKGWIYAYNQSVLGLELDPKLASDPTPSSVSEMRALSNTIAPNNGVCLKNAAQLESLQRWVKETEKNSEEATRAN